MFKRVGGFHLVLTALLTTLVFSGESNAEPSPWFGDLLVQFPDSLLLEREPGLLMPPTGPIPTPIAEDSPMTEDSGMTPVSSAEMEDSGQTLKTVDHQVPITAQTESACTGTNQRRYIFTEGRPCTTCENWQVLPDGILYPSYVAGEKEPRMAAAILNEKDRGPIFEATIGGRLGLLRYGTQGASNPQGWQWDLESAAMLRQDFQQDLDVEATDFRIGSVITWKRGATAVKGGVYHLSAHVGDEFLLRNPNFQRRNYSRDVILFGIRQLVTDEVAVYGEFGYAVRNDGGSEPIELQFGAEYTSRAATDPRGAPFAAINAHLREEFDFGGGLNILAGWEWRGPVSNHRLRIGGQFYTGKEIQWSFFDENVTLVGAGIWYDF